MGAKDDAEEAKSALLGLSPRRVLLIVTISATIMVLWPLGGLQTLFDSSDSPPPRPAHWGGGGPEQPASAKPQQSAPQETASQKNLRSAADAEVERLRAEVAQLRHPGASRPTGGRPLAPGETLADRAPARPLIGGSIAVHPPKYSFVGRFLEQWYTCEPARRAMDMYIVFWGEKDAALFKKGMAKLHPKVPDSAWTAVVCEVPSWASAPGGISNQVIAAWKKWYGVTYMMDLKEPPVYGLMLDSELLLYNTSDCGQNSEWHKMYDRVSALEAGKRWPAAQVNDAASYDFGDFKQSGKDYDKMILEDNARFIGFQPDEPGSICAGLNTPGCREVKRQIDLVLFSWWTDVPYMNLKVAERFLLNVVPPYKRLQERIPPGLGKWCSLAHQILFTRFEHIAYQMYTCMFEGYAIDDVTAVTGNAIWGSYLEDPKPQKGYGSSRIAELHPMWLPADARQAIHHGLVPPMSHIDPPLMHLHVDHFPHFHDYNSWEPAMTWNIFFKDEGTEWKYPS